MHRWIIALLFLAPGIDSQAASPASPPEPPVLPGLVIRPDVAIFQGTSGPDHVTLDHDPATGLVRIRVNASRPVVLPAGVQGVYADLHEGCDTWLNLTSLATVVRGGPGDDTLTTGLDPRAEALDFLYGGPGDDTLIGDPYVDALIEEDADPAERVIDTLGQSIFVYLTDRDDVVQVSDNPDQPDTLLVEFNPGETSFGDTLIVPGFNPLILLGNGGDDRFRNASHIPVYAYGGAGRDSAAGHVILLDRTTSQP